MNINQIISQLRSYCPALEGRVAGSADFDTGVDTTVNMALPAAYVIPLDDETSENLDMSGLQQLVHERIAVIVEFDASTDRRGQAAVSQVEAMKYDLFAALLNWQIAPARAVKGIEYAGSRLLAFDRARLFYQWDFALETTISDEDGYQVTAIPITEIDLDITVRLKDLNVKIPLDQP